MADRVFVTYLTRDELIALAKLAGSSGKFSELLEAFYHLSHAAFGCDADALPDPPNRIPSNKQREGEPTLILPPAWLYGGAELTFPKEMAQWSGFGALVQRGPIQPEQKSTGCDEKSV